MGPSQREVSQHSLVWLIVKSCRIRFLQFAFAFCHLQSNRALLKIKHFTPDLRTLNATYHGRRRFFTFSLRIRCNAHTMIRLK